MMSRRLNYANVTATLALFFAMSGGALAAKHYLLNSTKQINPKVLRALRGRTGATGAPGAPGAPGGTGKEGLAGKEGPTGPFPTGNAPRGITIRGAYGVFSANGTNGYSEISFGYTLAARPAIKYIAEGSAVPPECAGGTVKLPQAQPGNLCIFEAFHLKHVGGAFDPDPESFSTTVAGRTGAIVYDESTGGTQSAAGGSWAVTAP